MSEAILRLMVWGSAALLFYTFFGYALLLIVLSACSQTVSDIRYALFRRERRCKGTEPVPHVSLLIAAYNEESVITQKIRNCAELDYPIGLLDVLIGADGCADRTVELARSAAPAYVKVFDYRARRGKPMVLNDLVSEARGEILAFSDANTLIDPAALRAVVRHFGDPAVGCVAGELRLTTPQGGSPNEGLYWKYEVFLKILESRLNMVPGAHGGIFAIRRELYEALPRFGIIDDFLISMKIRGRGYRIVYDSEAVAYEEAALSIRHEFGRRVRIGAGGFHAIRETWRMLLPTAGLIAVAYWSHKVFRWLSPLAMIVAFAGSLALASTPLYGGIAAAAVAFALAAYVGYRREGAARPLGKFGLPYYFISMNLALFLGFLRFLNRSQKAAWTRTAREGPAA